MNIAVCGSGTNGDSAILSQAKEMGKEIARHKHTLLTGGCPGYPYAALRGALLQRGKIIVYSPAKNQEEHEHRYGFPIDEGVEYIYTGLGIPERNIPLVKAADIVVILDGQIGTLNEFTIAFNEKKKIAVLEAGRLHEVIPRIAEICNKKGEKEGIIYEKEMKNLIKKIVL